MSVLLKNGLVVTAKGSSVADVFVDGESIKVIGTGIVPDGRRDGGCTGKYILPGAIDPHTHIEGRSWEPPRRMTGGRYHRRGLWRNHHDHRLQSPRQRRVAP